MLPDVNEALVAAGLRPDDIEGSRFDTTHDAPVTVALAQMLAADIRRAFSPTVLATWNDPDDIVLTHLVATQLGTTWIRCYRDGNGRLRAAGKWDATDRVVYVTDAIRDSGRLEGVRDLLKGTAGQMVGAGVLISRGDPEDEGIPMVSLTKTPGRA